MRPLLFFAIALAAGTAMAQAPRKSAAQDARSVGSRKEAGRKAFKDGVKAFGEKRYTDALASFQEAHRLSGSYTVLFNVGHAYAALERAAEAEAALKQYLSEGAAEIKPGRRTDVEQLILQQQERVGTIVLRGLGAEVDGVWTEADKPLRVTAGRHTAVARAGTTDPSQRTKDVQVAAKATVEVRFEPPAPEPPPAAAAPATAPAVAAPAQPPMAPPVAQAGPPAPEVAAPMEGHEGARTQRTAGFVVLGLGLVSVGAGAAVALGAVGKANDAKQVAGATTSGAEWDAARSDWDNAKTQNTIGWGIAGVGSAAIVTGAVLLLTAPRAESAARITILPWATAGNRGVALRGSW